MPDISVDFHAAPDELREFVEGAVSDFGLHVVGIRYPPYEAIELEPARLDEKWNYSAPFQELAFTVDRPNLPVDGNVELVRKNPGVLRLMVGKRSEKGLMESWLSARTNDQAALAVWRKIAKRLKGMTKTGVTGVSPWDGASAPIRWHRYTAGAKALESSGVPMLTMGDTVLKFD